MTVPILRPTIRWYCPRGCGVEAVTHEARPHSRLHRCAKTYGLETPLLPVGTKGKVEVKEREDYIGTEMVQLDPERGRPVQSLITTRDEGQDVVMFMPAATLNGTANS
ncbi:MAG: hypothetical protein ACM3MJ_00290 [Deltaproteobacteria bacterium]